MYSWQDTSIWKNLKVHRSANATPVITYLNLAQTMESIQTVLNESASPATKDYTLHDSQHSYRVAERMWAIIPVETQEILSPYELGLLLASAYLHDIGMAPGANKIAHLVDLLNYRSQDGSVHEKETFQEWLDNQGKAIDLNEQLQIDDNEVALTVMQYCRYRHNDWSGEWISTHLGTIQMPGYSTWVGDLTKICKSHHYSLDELKQDTYDPLHLGDDVVHLRYLAMCLRMADVLDIDPERAPEILIHHRDVIDASLPHWFKERFTSVTIKDGFIVISAFPNRAFEHKAILEACNWIETEANLCFRLASEKPLNNIHPGNNLKHSWKISPYVVRDVKASGNYVFVESAFRPNTNRIIELLAGTELYSDPLMAIRELIQNAMDAVKKRIGYIVVRDSIIDKEEINRWQKKFKISVKVFNDGQDYWLSCEDDGIGMSQSDIVNSFLVSGSPKSIATIRLERECKKLHYDINYTGEFGIGALSYFMIAQNLTLQTKLAPEVGIHPIKALDFNINGLFDFGEIREIQKATAGTAIKLKLKRDTDVSIERLTDFFQETFLEVPCNVTAEINNETIVSWEPGWVNDTAQIATLIANNIIDKLLEQFDGYNGNKFISPDDIDAASRYLDFVESVRNDVDLKQKIVTVEFFSHETNVHFRAHVPVYIYDDGPSLSYIYRGESGQINWHETPNGLPVLAAWKGVSTKLEDEQNIMPNAIIEANFLSHPDRKISISRNNILSFPGISSIPWKLVSKVELELGERYPQFWTGPFSLINLLYASHNSDKPFSADGYYFHYSQKHGNRLRKVSYPLLIIANDLLETKKYFYKGVATCNLQRQRPFFDKIQVDIDHFEMDRLCLLKRPNIMSIQLCLLKIDKLSKLNDYRYLGNSAEFPPSWCEVLAVKLDARYTIINRGHKLFKRIDREQLLRIDKIVDRSEISVNEIQAHGFVDSIDNLVAWLLFVLTENEEAVWQNLQEYNKPFLASIGDLLQSENESAIRLMAREPGGLVMHSFSLGNYVRSEEGNDVEEMAESVDESWIIS